MHRASLVLGKTVRLLQHATLVVSYLEVPDSIWARWWDYSVDVHSRHETPVETDFVTGFDFLNPVEIDSDFDAQPGLVT